MTAFKVQQYPVIARSIHRGKESAKSSWDIARMSESKLSLVRSMARCRHRCGTAGAATLLVPKN